jgi:hypothetical protein
VNAARDRARHEVAARGLTPTAVAHLTRDALGTIDLAALAPVKKLLKQFFSAAPWTEADDDALAALAGSGAGWWHHALDEDLDLDFGWRDGAFRLDVVARAEPADPFGGPVVPEATPNPRSIRFVTPEIHNGPSRWYESAAGADDPRVTRLFAEFDDVANVLVGPTFVAIGLHRPDRWEVLLAPILATVTAEFASTDRTGPGATSDGAPTAPSAPARTGVADRATALDTAWKTLGSLRPAASGDLDRIRAAVSSSDTAERQVAARVLVDADPDAAQVEWERLLGDPSRTVRRATVDAMVDAARPALRALLERALADADAWTRWKALRGLVDLGIAPSRAVIAPLAWDPDFRVRLEAAGALRDRGEG